MKNVMIPVLALLVLNGASGIAQGRTRDKEFALASIYKQKQNEKVKIKKEDLPEAARNTLESDAFKGWTVENAYKLSNGEFEVELKKGTTSQTVKFDKDGKVK